jgi:DNA-binding transcriptional ArsR family regulator
VSQLAAKYQMSFAAVQKHVAVLEKAGLLTKRRSGREQLASGDVEAVRSVTAMLTELEQLWRGRIARIDALIAADLDSAPDPPQED